MIDHQDLDSLAARSLIDCRPAAVINAADSLSGRYPNRGPGLLLEAGIPLIDQCGAAVMTLGEGTPVQIDGGQILAGGMAVAGGRRVSLEDVKRGMAAGQANLRHELQAFARNTLEYLEREHELAFADLALPPMRTPIAGRPVLVVVRGEGYKQDLLWVMPYVTEQKPVLIAVDGGADALLEMGLKPDIILGDMDSAGDEALRCGAELVVHIYSDGRPSPGVQRLQSLGLSYHSLACPGMSEDLALLLAHQAGATLIAVVGTHFSLQEFLDKRRPGMASTLLTRLRVGSILVDAKGLNRLYRPAASARLISGIFLSAFLAVGVVIANSIGLQRWLGILGMSIEVWLRRHGIR